MSCWINGTRCLMRATDDNGGLLSMGGSCCSECKILSQNRERIERILEEVRISPKWLTDNLLFLRQTIMLYREEIEGRLDLYDRTIKEKKDEVVHALKTVKLVIESQAGEIGLNRGACISIGDIVESSIARRKKQIKEEIVGVNSPEMMIEAIKKIELEIASFLASNK